MIETIDEIERNLNKMKTYNEIVNDINWMVNEFIEANGKRPNEIHIRGHYQQILTSEWLQTSNVKISPYITSTPALFMGMRVFWELTSFYPAWTEETELLLANTKKQKLCEKGF